MTKVTLQLLTYQPWMTDVLNAWGAEYVKWLQPERRDNPFPNQRIIARQWTDDRDAGYISRGEAGGRQFVDDMLAGDWAKVPYAHAYELANEPACRDLAELSNLRLYTIGAMKRANERGIRLVTLNLAEGNPAADGGLQGVAARNSERWRWAQLAEAVRLAAADIERQWAVCAMGGRLP